MEVEIDEDNETVIEQTKIEWSPEHEQILIEWADKAMCYRWLHSKANLMYGKLNAWYTVPVIIISTLTGTANFAQQRVPVSYQSLFIMAAGGFNILAGIITTIQQFLKITQLNEAHRVSTIAWDKFYRNIKIELDKHPIERIDLKHMLKMSKEEFDRLIETSPSIPDKIIEEFKHKFEQQVLFDKIIKPEICDILIPTSEYRNPWYTEENQTKVINDAINNQLIKKNKVKKQNELDKKRITEFIILFNNLNNREPMETEIIDNLKDKIDVNKIKTILEQNKVLDIKKGSIDDSNDNEYTNIV